MRMKDQNSTVRPIFDLRTSIFERADGEFYSTMNQGLSSDTLL